ncbi:DUF6483 family protein [Paenibacillus sp. GCM10023252]|uniref:DUF6483 family protein n=1 Tax=Paenibacillus sp. GCM10023252 TaxID=3252649 RepID=UPI00360A66FF
MFQRDYLMRMISQMTEALGQVMGLRRELKHVEALLVIDELLDKKFRLNGRLIRSLSEEDLISMMTTSGVMEEDNLGAIALLMKQEAEIYEELGKEEASFALHVKCLQLVMRLSLRDAHPSLMNPVKEAYALLDVLSPYELPAATKELLMEWYESQGRFDLAENTLYERIRQGGLMLSEAEAFYHRLLLQPDERLVGGGLPRAEVIQGLADLKVTQTTDSE